MFLGFPHSLLTKTSQSSDVRIVAFEIVKRKLNSYYDYYEPFFHPRIFFRDCSSFFMFDKADSSNFMKLSNWMVEFIVRKVS